jgi:hypothetical protein
VYNSQSRCSDDVGSVDLSEGIVKEYIDEPTSGGRRDPVYPLNSTIK